MTNNEPKKKSYKGIIISIIIVGIIIALAIGFIGVLVIGYLGEKEDRINRNNNYRSCMEAAQSLPDDDAKGDNLFLQSSRKTAIRNCENKYGDK